MKQHYGLPCYTVVELIDFQINERDFVASDTHEHLSARYLRMTLRTDDGEETSFFGLLTELISVVQGHDHIIDYDRECYWDITRITQELMTIAVACFARSTLQNWQTPNGAWGARPWPMPDLDADYDYELVRSKELEGY